MNIFLVDYENTKDLTGIDTLSKDDIVAIFYSKNSNTLTFETSENLHKSKANITYYNVEVGKQNALDFQLATYLGYLIKENENNASAKFYILSKDTGFSFVISFCKKLNVNVSLVTNFCKQTQSESKSKSEQEIRDLLSKSDIKNKLKEKDIDEILKIINQYKTITAINNNLCKYLKDTDLVGKILKIIKPKLTSQLNKK